MPKKGNNKEPNKEQKNPQGIPVVNGVQSSLVWVRPHTNRDLNFYMPPGEFTADTEKGFRKVMKDYFLLDFEGNWQDVISRLVVTNRTTKDFVTKYAANMEELDLMPDCKEKFDKKAAEAEELQKGLLYEMAKGGLAIFKPGESQPRQIRCDKDPKVMVVTEPLADCFIGEIQKKYMTPFQPRPVPMQPLEPKPPKDFDDPEPTIESLVKPQPVTVKDPGACPKENRIKKRPENLKMPEDILKDTTREKLVDDLYKQKLAKYTEGLVKPEQIVEEPELEAEDPGEFTTKPPKDVVIPEKPAAWDIAKAMEEEAAKIDTHQDPKYYYISLYEPGPFDMPEPKRPELDEPEFPEPPELIALTGDKPAMKYIFDEPKLELLKPEGLVEPVEPKLDLSDLKEPAYPELRDEPPAPGRLKRMFSFFSSDWKKQILDHDNWVRERDTLAERRAEWEDEHAKYADKVNFRREQYEAEKAKYDREKEAYDAALQEFGPENDMRRVTHDAEVRAYEQGLKELGGAPYITALNRHMEEPDNPKATKEYEDLRDMALAKLKVQKFEYERKLAEWQEKNKASIEENKERNAAYDVEVADFELRRAEYEKNFEGCNTPEEIAARREQLDEIYKEDLRYYFDWKEKHENRVEGYKEQVRKCREHAIANNIDPEEALKANRDRVERQLQSDKAFAEVGQFIQDHPEIGRYDQAVAEAQDEEEWRGVYESRLEDWKEEKAEYEKAKLEYDQKLAAYKDFKAAQENYDKKFKEASEKALFEARNEIDKAIHRNHEEIATFDERNAANKHEQELWDRENERVNENNRKMHEPGGLIYRWEENVKAYANDVRRYNREVVAYNRKVRELPERHQEWRIRKNAHDRQVLEYDAKKQVYDEKIREIQSIEEQNRLEKGSIDFNDMKNPLYRDYMENANVTGYYSWNEYMNGNFKQQARQGRDLSKEEKLIKDASKQYQKAKNKAPKTPSAQEQQNYIKRVNERNKQQKLAKEQGIDIGNLNPFLK